MKITGYEDLEKAYGNLEPLDEEKMKDCLYETDQLAISLNDILLQTYTGGFIDKSSSQCTTYGISHVVTLVRFGNEGVVDY